jgi:iron(III) transport system ATP-binding protein
MAFNRFMTSIIQLKHVSKSYGTIKAVHNVSLSVREGEIMALLGPSGCGKTTMLRLIAGLERPDSGEIILNGKVVAGRGQWQEPETRRVGFVFQDYALFPHLSVAENVVFGLRGWERGDKRARIDELLELVGLPGLKARMPHELSGGQQQRVALARALAPRPDVMLLDEPFSNLDAALRQQVRAEVRDILHEAGVTTVFVTHDQEEALSLADEVAVMFSGELAQVGHPQDIYRFPGSAAVAAFVGEANFLPAEADGTQAVTALGTIRMDTAAQGSVTLLVRPESLRLDAENGTGVEAKVEQVAFFGHDQHIYLTLASGERLLARDDAYTTYEPGQMVRVGLRYPARPLGV